jgi:hypothetical protein
MGWCQPKRLGAHPLGASALQSSATWMPLTGRGGNILLPQASEKAKP